MFHREAEFDWAHELQVTVLRESRSRVQEADTKDLNRIVDQKLAQAARPSYGPPPDHPWRKKGQAAAALAEARNAQSASSTGVNP